MSILSAPPRLAEKPDTRHWTAEEFYRAAAAGEFDDPGRLELIQGRIIEKMPTGPLHTTVSYDIAEQLRAVAGPDLLVREERAIHFAFDGEPIPDIALVRGKSSEYRKAHPAPGNVALLVEVSVSTMEYDLGEKALMYANAGIAEYWVVIPQAQTVVVHRQPSPAGYQSVARLSATDTLSPLAMPGAIWTINELLGHTDVPEEN